MRPRTYQEHFNMRHRNVIECAFGIIKMWWGILRSVSFYHIKTHIRLAMACFLLHNYIRNKMSVDLAKVLFDTTENEQDDSAKIPNVHDSRYFVTIFSFLAKSFRKEKDLQKISH
ncbi:hypothetical protein ACS0TY_029555 [Phlomoides rotata]